MSEKTKQPMLSRHRIMTVESVREYLFATIFNNISNPTFKSLIGMVLYDHRFWECPAAKSRHQAFPGGLAIHTAQVLQSAIDMLHSVEKIRFEEMCVAVVWHDYEKLFDYTAMTINVPGDEGLCCINYDYTTHKDLIGHLSKSYALFVKAAVIVELEPDVTDFIGHLILSHHGRREWGSPVEPICAEAWAIHCADMLSSQYIED